VVVRSIQGTIRIENQLAVTHLEMVFYNPGTRPAEGSNLFPLPGGAAISGFKLWVDGEPVEGTMMDAGEARDKYEEIVRTLRDPGLLEYVGRGAVQANVFPIPPSGERKFAMEYSQVLTAENGLVRVDFPLKVSQFTDEAVKQVAVTVDISAEQPLRAVYSPSHAVSVSYSGDRQATASYEASDVLIDSDFSLFYSLGESQAFHLFSYRNPSDTQDPDGFFLLLLAPKPDQDSQAIAKDVILVMDRSGSMEGEKIVQTRQAARYILQHLNEEDRFGLISFNSNIDAFSPELNPANRVDQALTWVDGLTAVGSTDINRALLEAASMADRERPTYLIFLTDGLPTQGETEAEKIIQNFSGAAPADLRLFNFGVGYDVDTFLLDSLSQEHHGLSTYVSPGEALDETVSGFYARISTPVLTNLKLDFGGLSVSDVYPQPLPDLFAGSQVIVVGRYTQGGTKDVTLSGLVNGQEQKFVYKGQFFSADNISAGETLASLPRLWATRKVGALLNTIRLKGADKETVDQIVKLSIRYGIVTPYTSYLVTEPMTLGAANQEQLSDQTFQNLQAAPTQSRSGQQAFEKAAGEGALSQADVAPSMPQTSNQQVRTVGSRTFLWSDDTWIDTEFDAATMKPRQVTFLSEDYFALAGENAEVASALSLGEHVILIYKGQAYEILPGEVQSAQTGTPAALATSTPEPPSTLTSTPASPVSASPTPTPVNPGRIGGYRSNFPVAEEISRR
jgi:Ca-activated chloride channel family protein